MACVVCGTTTGAGLAPWHRICSACGYESAALQPTINDDAAHAQVDEAEREAGLKGIRQQNFEVIIDHAARLAPPAATSLLDVGSAHGWFLEAAAGRFGVLGLEPDTGVAAATAARGLPVRQGYFPDALRDGERFDLIVFNDVIEHIPDIRAALAACHARLAPDGLLILNLPSSAGLFYRLAKLLARAGVRGPFERLWQKGLPSPHVHYFRPSNLTALAESEGFTLQLSTELPAVRAAGLMARLRCAGKSRPAALYATYLAVLLALPVLRAFPSDIALCLYRKRPA